MTASADTKNRLLNRILPKRETKAFGSLEIYPKRLRFKTQNSGEKIFILARAHIITNLGWIIRISILSVIPIIAGIAFTEYNLDLGFLESGIVMFLVVGFYLSLSTSALLNLMSWYYDLYLVTSSRIIHYEYQPLASYRISEAEINNIQDVTQSTIGFAPSLFGYGDIIVRTASSRNKFYFRAVPKPLWFRDVITDLARLSRVGEP